MNIAEIRSLWGFNVWATHKILDACQVLSDDEFNRNLGNSFSSVRATLVHIMGAEWLWLQQWLGDSPRSLLPQEEFPNLAAIESRWITLEKQEQAFFLTLTDDRLARVRALNEVATRRGQTLAELALVWALRDPRMTSLVISASSVAQLEDNVAALANTELTDGELAEIDRYALESGIDLWAGSSAE